MLRLINTHQDLPKEKVGRPAARYICEVCKNYLRNGNVLREHMMSTHTSHMMTIHKNPLKKQVKEVESHKNSDTKDIIVSNLETIQQIWLKLQTESNN